MAGNIERNEHDGKLIRLTDAIQALVDADEVKGLAYLQMEANLEAIPIIAIVRDCAGCMGATMGDCETCDVIKDLRKETDK